MSASIVPGRRFGRWTVIVAGGPTSKWGCKCDCGTVRSVYAPDLRAGKSKSCGCLRNEITAARSYRHGYALGRRRTPEYQAWHDMKRRCENPQHNRYADWGGRGIGVRFQNFGQFLNDVGPRPSPQHSIDRIDNDGDYAPGNVRWATSSEQRRNQRKLAA
jgi:hypothetical protein